MISDVEHLFMCLLVIRMSSLKKCLFRLSDVFVLFFLFRAASAASGSSQARGGIGAEAASLCYSHSNTGSELHL